MGPYGLWLSGYQAIRQYYAPGYKRLVPQIRARCLLCYLFRQRDPKTLLPNDLDVVFISTYTQASALAYALAKLYRKEKTLTVIGGPHAKQFPEDCLRFFDIVVGDCDETLINEILRDKPRNLFLTSGRTLTEIPGVEERMPEIRASTFLERQAVSFYFYPFNNQRRLSKFL